MKLLLKIRIFLAFFSLVKDPRNTDRIFVIGETMRKGRRDVIEKAFARFLTDPEFRALYDSRTDIRLDLITLRQCPPGSFGRATAEFLDANGFEANSFPVAGFDEPIAFMVTRLRQCHDLWHVLTGYPTDIPSELGLQGFTYAQVGALISPMIIAGGILHLLTRSAGDVPRAFEQIVDGYRRGQKCRALVTCRLEAEWNTDLGELRRKYGLPSASAVGQVA